MPSSSFVLSVGTLLLSSLVSPIQAKHYFRRTNAPQYELSENLSGSNFFDGFNFMTSQQYLADPLYKSSDPTKGFVNYVDKKTAEQSGLISFPDGKVTWGVDSTNPYTPGKDIGRPSIRIEGKKSYTHGLFIADIQHMPGSACGIWPAFWTLGSGLWPYNGEIDILEQVNFATNNQVVLHTSDSCTMTSGPALAPIKDVKTGIEGSGNCATNYSSSGCPVQGSGANNYGDNFNANGGGVYALQWTSDFIKVWFFPRNSLPSTLSEEVPDISKFGTPQANFVGTPGCNIDQRFLEHRIVFDTTFCGDWAGNVYPSTCPQTGSNMMDSCYKYVGATPEAFRQAYWQINSIKMYNEKKSSNSTSNNSTNSSLPPSVSGPSGSIRPSGSVGPTGVVGPTGSPNGNSTAMPTLPPFRNTTNPSGTWRPAGSGRPTGSRRSTGGVGPSSSSRPGSPSGNGTPAPQTTGPPTRPTSRVGSGSRATITTVIVTSYVDICPTGLTTKTLTTTLTYCPACQTKGAPPPGFTTTVTYCPKCVTPGTVTLTIPAGPTPTPARPTVPTGGTIYSTRIITITACPPSVPNCPAGSTYTTTTVYPVPPPAVQTPPTPGKPVPCSGAGCSLVPIGTGSVNKITSTLKPVQFTGAATKMEVGVAAFVGAVAAAFL